MCNLGYEKKKMQNALTECSALVIIIVFIWSITCGSKGIWPFGQMMLDIGDMAEQCVPVYTHIWDVIHGQKSLFFDWHTGLGNNMAGVVLHFGLISPFNIFFLFIKRFAIEESMSIYILIKYIAIGFSMRFLLRKWFPELTVWMCISFSLLYVFSAFNLQYYYAPMWLDVSFMFPIVMYGYFLWMNKGEKIPYIICLAITCMMSFQHTYMLFLMLLFLTGFLPLLSKEKYQKRLPGLLVATIFALMLAAWILIPGAIQILQASRADANHGLVEIWSSVWIFFTAKWMKLLNMGIPLSFFLVYAGKNIKEKSTKFFVFLIMILCAPIVLESSNLLWHGGSYQGYTMRYSYMLAFWILAAGAYAYKNIIMFGGGRYRKVINNIVGIASLLLLLAVAAVQYLLLKDDTTVYKRSISAAVIIVMIGITMIGGLGFLYSRKKAWEKFILVVVIFQSLTLALSTIQISGEKGNSFFTMSSAVSENNIENVQNPMIRIKSMDAGLSHNYPLIMRKNAISNYFGVNGEKQLIGVARMGYAQVGYRMSDYGGTLFSDALLGVNEVIGAQHVNENLYQHQNTYGKYNTYKSLYGYKQGIRIKNNNTVLEVKKNDPFFYQNQIAREILDYEPLTVIEAGSDIAELEIDEKSILYLYAENEEEFEEVVVTDINTAESYQLKMPESGWMNGILELGIWEDAALRVQVNSKTPVKKIVYATLALHEFVEKEPTYYSNYFLSRQRNSLRISLDGAEKDDALFLPLYNDKGWKCIVNGEKAKVDEVADIFMAVPLQPGKNEIRLFFSPQGMKLGIAITVLGVIGLLIIIGYPTKRNWETTGKVFWVLDEVLFMALTMAFYIIPVLFLVKELIKGI